MNTDTLNQLLESLFINNVSDDYVPVFYQIIKLSNRLHELLFIYNA